MEISALQPRVVASDLPPEKLAGNSRLSEGEKIAEASRQFEALLLRQILQSTQKTVIHSKYSDNSTAAGIYRDMVTERLADSISKSGGFGLARTFEQQLSPKTADKVDNQSPAPAPTTPTHAGMIRPGYRPATTQKISPTHE
jgi:flagellar protein FlgJ